MAPAPDGDVSDMAPKPDGAPQDSSVQAPSDVAPPPDGGAANWKRLT